MTRRPGQTPRPLPTPLAMSTAPADPTPSPIPKRPKSPHSGPDDPCEEGPKPPKPKQRLHLDDLTHAGTRVFLEHARPGSIVEDATRRVFDVLYRGGGDVPPVRSVTLILLPMGGIANTSGLELDNEHKEIRFSLDYIAGLTDRSAAGQCDEIFGVIVHEMVHVWQWNGQGQAPSGLIEGIADFVRLKAGLASPNWTHEAGEKWDAGYAATAYFLEWLDGQAGGGLLPRLNQMLRHRYVEETLWPALCNGHEVGDLFKRYKQALQKPDEYDSN